MTYTDQNAFGLLVAFFDIEDVEYSSSRAEFVERFEAFRRACLTHVEQRPLAPRLLALELGHAVYFELEDGDQLEDPLGWLRALTRELATLELAVLGVLTHGGRWVEERESAEPPLSAPGVELVRGSRPSEPLRRALYAEAAAHGNSGDDGWGPGVFVDEEAVEALKRTFKNAPTPLDAGGARFFRMGS